jgi:hypothetical protein
LDVRNFECCDNECECDEEDSLNENAGSGVWRMLVTTVLSDARNVPKRVSKKPENV